MTTTCAICTHPSPTGTRVHQACATTLTGNLHALPWLYADLGELLTPGSPSGEPGRTTGCHAPLPLREDVLDLRGPGGIVGILSDWESAVRDAQGADPAPFRGSIEQAVTAAAQWLAAQVPWIGQHFDPAADLDREIRQLRTRCETVDGMATEPRERRIPVACPCGWTLRITVATSGEYCARCDTWYSHDEVLQLPYAGRHIAAA